MKVQELLCRLFLWTDALGVGLISTSVVWSLPSAVHGLWRVKSGGQASADKNSALVKRVSDEAPEWLLIAHKQITLQIDFI